MNISLDISPFFNVEHVKSELLIFLLWILLWCIILSLAFYFSLNCLPFVFILYLFSSPFNGFKFWITWITVTNLLNSSSNFCTLMNLLTKYLYVQQLADFFSSISFSFNDLFHKFWLLKIRGVSFHKIQFNSFKLVLLSKFDVVPFYLCKRNGTLNIAFVTSSKTVYSLIYALLRL